MSKPTLAGVLCGTLFTLLGMALAAGAVGHPVDGQLPGDWGWSAIMIGAALLLAAASGRVRALWRNRTRPR